MLLGVGVVGVVGVVEVGEVPVYCKVLIFIPIVTFTLPTCSYDLSNSICICPDLRCVCTALCGILT